MAMVVDEYGTLQGVVTLEDLLEEKRSGFDNSRVFQRFLGERVSLSGPMSAAGVAISGETVGELAWDLPHSRHQRGVASLITDMEFENEILNLLGAARASRDEADVFQDVLHDAMMRLEAVLR